MEVLSLKALRGINLWTDHTALEALVRCTKDEIFPTTNTSICQRLQDWGLGTQQSLEDMQQDFLSMAHVLEFLALEFQVCAECPVSFSLTHETSEEGIYKVIVEYSQESVGRLAFEKALYVLEHLESHQVFELTPIISALRTLNRDVRFGPSTGSIIKAAQKRGIPYHRLTEGSLVQLGFGAKQRRIRGSEINSTNNVAEEIAQDKNLTKRLLMANGIPVPQGRVVYTADEAWEAAQDIGLPVVIKPTHGNQGDGVTGNITTHEAVIKAFDYAKTFEDRILVETFIRGSDYRLLVVGNQMIAAAHRTSPMVVGNGSSTIAELIQVLNLDPKRGEGHNMPMTLIEIDQIILDRMAEEGYTLETVLPAGKTFILRFNANLSNGGSATDVTEQVHHSIAALAVEAALCIGLNPCGLDLVCEDITKPLDEQSGAFIELNASPGLRMHLFPSHGTPQPVGDAIMNEVFAPGDDGRIPLVAVTGNNGKTTTVRFIAHILREKKLTVGMTTTEGVYLNDMLMESGDCSGPKSARKVLNYPEVEAAVLETARGGILREGLAFDFCNVAVVTNLGVGDHLGMNYINTVEELAQVKQTVVRSVAENGYAVLNAADPLVLQMADVCNGSVIFFARDPSTPALQAHLKAGGKGLYIHNDHLVAQEGDHQERIPLKDIPLTHNGTIDFQVENTLATVGAAWGLNIDWSLIRQGVKSFGHRAEHAPGRFNVFHHNKARIIVDYGHNPDAIRAILQAVQTLPATRKTVVFSGAGDRQDAVLAEMAQDIGHAFDHVLLFEDQCQRGREDGVVLEIMNKAIIDGQCDCIVEQMVGEFLAIDTALNRLQEGDLCLIFIDQVTKGMDHLTKRIQSS